MSEEITWKEVKALFDTEANKVKKIRYEWDDTEFFFEVRQLTQKEFDEAKRISNKIQVKGKGRKAKQEMEFDTGAFNTAVFQAGVVRGPAGFDPKTDVYDIPVRIRDEVATDILEFNDLEEVVVHSFRTSGI